MRCSRIHLRARWRRLLHIDMSLGVLVQEHPPRRVHPPQGPHAQTERGSNDRGLHRAWSSRTPLSGAPASCALATPQASGAPSPRPSRRVDVPSDASGVRDPYNQAVDVAAVDGRLEIGRRINGPARSVGCRSLHQSRPAISRPRISGGPSDGTKAASTRGISLDLRSSPSTSLNRCSRARARALAQPRRKGREALHLAAREHRR